jgi:hypothetical protein
MKGKNVLLQAINGHASLIFRGVVDRWRRWWWEVVGAIITWLSEVENLHK